MTRAIGHGDSALWFRARRWTVILALVVAASGCSDRPAPQLPPQPLPVQTFELGGSPWGVVADGDRVWVSNAAHGRVVQLGSDGALLRQLPVPPGDLRSAGLAFGSNRLWVVNLGGRVRSIAVDQSVPDRTGAVSGEAADLTVDDSRVWVAGHGPSGGLVRLDPTSLRLVRQPVLTESPFQVELAGKDLWVAGLDDQVFRLDADSGAVRSATSVGPAPRGLAVTSQAVWVSVRDTGTLVRLDSSNGAREGQLQVGGQPWPVAADGDEVWVADLQGWLIRADAATMTITHRTPIPEGARGLALTSTAVWVTGAGGTVSRVPRP